MLLVFNKGIRVIPLADQGDGLAGAIAQQGIDFQAKSLPRLGDTHLEGFAMRPQGGDDPAERRVGLEQSALHAGGQTRCHIPKVGFGYDDAARGKPDAPVQHALPCRQLQNAKVMRRRPPRWTGHAADDDGGAELRLDHGRGAAAGEQRLQQTILNGHAARTCQARVMDASLAGSDAAGAPNGALSLTTAQFSHDAKLTQTR